MVAAVEPQWIEAAGAHLIKRSYSEPHWVEERGFVAAFESTSLYGLTLSARRRVNYGSVAPHGSARDLRTRSAGRRTDALARAVPRPQSAPAARSRAAGSESSSPRHPGRRAGDVRLLSAAPAGRRALDSRAGEVAASAHRMARQGGRRRSRCRHPAARCTMTRSDLMRRDVPEVTPTSHPDTLRRSQATSCRSSTASNPARATTASRSPLPLPLLAAATPATSRAPIPGWRVEKITELLRALPKRSARRSCPCRSTPRARRRKSTRARGFHAALAEWITRNERRPLTTAEELAALPLPPHLRFNMRVVDLQGARAGGRSRSRSR